MDQISVAKRVKELFEAVCEIPRPSFHEERIADFICEFAKAHRCEVYRDGAHNVLVNVKATKGFENAEPIALQGHTDMVCEKNKDVEHDFLNEGLKLYEKDGWLRARGTTLGADDGVAVAIMLFVIEGGVERHGDVQCLFTTAEEVGLDGVKCFDFSRVYCKKMINMDGESEGSVIVGCAGGLRSDISFAPKCVKAQGEGLTIKVSGLCGGHSGENISSGRANANLILGELLSALLCEDELSIVAIGGGSKDNAIPREAFATVAVKDAAKAKKTVTALAKEIEKTLSADDAAFSVSCTETELCGKDMMDTDTTASIITFITCAKNGVLEMSKKLSGLVEFSKNLGVIKMTEDGKVVVTISSRSAVDSQLDMSVRGIDLLAKACGAATDHHSRYPGWDFTGESEMANEFISVFDELYGIKVEKNIIHAGLECGVIKSALGELDCISCGPTVLDLHSPNEALDIASMGRYAYAVYTMLKNAK